MQVTTIVSDKSFSMQFLETYFMFVLVEAEDRSYQGL